MSRAIAAVTVSDRVPARAESRASETRRYYDGHASAYAAATREATLGVPVSLLADHLPSQSRILDLGSGSGRDLKAFIARGADALGLDFSAPLAALAQEASGAPVVVADMTDIPLEDASVDGVWASASLLHLSPEDMDRALHEVRRVLRPQGLLFTSMKTGRGQHREPCGRWFSYVDPREWQGRILEAGFEILTADLQDEIRHGVEDGVVHWTTCLARRA